MSTGRLFALLAALYPPPSRRYAADMVEFMTARHARAVRERRRLRFWIDLGTDTIAALFRAWAAYLREEAGRMVAMDVPRIALHESGLRFLRRRKVAAATAVGTLALALGANTMALAVVDAFLLSSFGIPDSDRVMGIVPNREVPGFGSVPFAEAWPNYRMLEETSTAFSDVAALTQGTFSWDDGQDARALAGARVTASFFATTVVPQLGRGFDAAEEGPSPARVAVISNGLWREAFSSDPQVIGRTIALDGILHEIVGVMPPGFKRPLPATDVWLPFDLPANQWDRILGARSLTVYGRLAPGGSVRQGEAEMQAFTRRATQATPDNEGFTYGLLRLRQQEMPRGDRAVVFVQVGSFLLLLLALVNLVVVLIAWGVDRRQEMSVRLALGAGVGRLALGLLFQGMAVVLAASAGGFALASVALGALQRIAVPPPLAPYLAELGLDVRVFATGVAVAALAGLLASSVPAWLGRRAAVGDSLRSGARGTGLSPQAVRVQRAMLTLQATFAVVLLACAGALGLSFRNLARVAPGFQTGERMVARVQLPAATYGTHDQRAQFALAVTHALAEQPEIARSGFTTVLPLGDVNNVGRFVAMPEEADPTLDPPPASFKRISPDYFATMGTPILAGRPFDQRDDAASAPVVVVSRSLADRLWGDTDPVGKPLYRMVPDGPPQRLDVVGVVADVMDGGFDREPGQTVYAPFAQSSTARLTFVVEPRSSAEAAMAGFRRALRAAAPGVAASSVVSLDSIVRQANLLAWLQSTLLSAFALIALCIALLGTYGVMSQIVATHQRDHALRLALGAVPAGIATSVLRSAAVFTLPGLVLGIGAAALLSRFLRPLTFGVEGRTAWICAGAGVVMLLVVTAATMPAAVRAARVRVSAAIGAE